jgi:hypothetical protein
MERIQVNEKTRKKKFEVWETSMKKNKTKCGGSIGIAVKAKDD